MGHGWCWRGSWILGRYLCAWLLRMRRRWPVGYCRLYAISGCHGSNGCGRGVVLWVEEIVYLYIFFHCIGNSHVSHLHGHTHTHTHTRTVSHTYLLTTTLSCRLPPYLLWLTQCSTNYSLLHSRWTHTRRHNWMSRLLNLSGTILCHMYRWQSSTNTTISTSYSLITTLLLRWFILNTSITTTISITIRISCIKSKVLVLFLKLCGGCRSSSSCSSSSCSYNSSSGGSCSSMTVPLRVSQVVVGDLAVGIRALYVAWDGGMVWRRRRIGGSGVLVHGITKVRSRSDLIWRRHWIAWEEIVSSWSDLRIERVGCCCCRFNWIDVGGLERERERERVEIDLQMLYVCDPHIMKLWKASLSQSIMSISKLYNPIIIQ